MAWIESHQSLAAHRKTRRLSKELGVSKPQAIGHLHLLWWWCMDNAPDGQLSDIDHDEISEVAMWEGEPFTFMQALIASGFVDTSDDGSTVLHDWHDYAGKLIEKREKDRIRKSESRLADSPTAVVKKVSASPKSVQRTSIGQVMDSPKQYGLDVIGQSTDAPCDGAGTVPTVPTVPNQETPTEGDDRPAFWLICKTGEPCQISEAAVLNLLAKYPGTDVRNIGRRLMDYSRKHPRPEKDDPRAWFESKIAQEYEAIQAKRLALSETAAKKAEAIIPHRFWPEWRRYEDRTPDMRDMTEEQYDQLARVKQMAAERHIKQAANG